MTRREARQPGPQLPVPDPPAAYSPRSTGAAGCGAAAAPAPPPAPSATSASVRFLTGSPRPHSACSLPAFLKQGQEECQEKLEGLRAAWSTGCDEVSPPRHGRVDRITPSREAHQDAEPWNSELASHCRFLENHASRKRRGREVKDSTVGVPPGNILCTENGQDDSR